MSNEAVGIYFLCSGRIGIPILEAILWENQFSNPRVKLLGIGSQPDKPSGRNRRLAPTEFARYAKEKGFEVDKISSVNTPEFLQKMRDLKVEMLVVVAFGQLLKKEILNLPPFGCLNVHASILPKYRGACPINMAILNGDRETGVTFMRMNAGLDTGPIYHIVRATMLPEENTGQLELRLGGLAAKEFVNVCHGICRQGWQYTEQPATDAPNVRKISKNDGRIDWNSPAVAIGNMIRAYTPWPKAFSFVTLKGERKRLQVTKAVPEELPVQDGGDRLPPGQVLQADAKGFVVVCGDGALRIVHVVPEGKKEMPAADFLRGNAVQPGDMLG